jgi:hypothetical protein
MVAPRVHVDALITAKLSHQLGVQNPEGQAELVPQLFSPLHLEASGAHDEDPTRAVPKYEFLSD